MLHVMVWFCFLYGNMSDNLEQGLCQSRLMLRRWLQVVYILDQVRALEAEMRARLRRAGLPPEAARILVVTRLIPDVSGCWLVEWQGEGSNDCGARTARNIADCEIPSFTRSA